MNELEVNLYGKKVNSLYELKICETKYRIETSWRWNDPKDRQVLDSSNTDIIMHNTKEELYHNILELLWGKALKMKVNNSFNELNLSTEGPYLDLECDNSIYNVYLRLNPYTAILENEYKEGLEFKNYIKKFIKEKKNCDINIDNRLEKNLIKFNYTNEERKNYNSDCLVVKLSELYNNPDIKLCEEYPRYVMNLIYFKIALLNWDYNFHVRPKDVKPLITKDLDRIIFKTKDYYDPGDIDIEVLESKSYDKKYKFTEDAKDKLYEKVSLLKYNRFRKRKEYITTYTDTSTNTLFICMFELSETEINNMKSRIQRLHNSFADEIIKVETNTLDEEESTNKSIEDVPLPETTVNKETDKDVKIDEKNQLNIDKIDKSLEIYKNDIKTSIGRDVSLRKDKNDIYYFLDYNAYYIKGTKTRSPEFDDNIDGQVLNLKKDEDENTFKRNTAIGFFKKILDICEFKVNDENTIVTIVPSSKQYKYGKGLAALAEIIANKNDLDLDLGILVRRNSIDKLSRGGDRHKDVHFNSISATSSSKILGKSIILIDDVTTTGNSLLACKEILLNSGAARVDCISLAKTKHRTNSGDDLFFTWVPNELATF